MERRKQRDPGIFRRLIWDRSVTLILVVGIIVSAAVFHSARTQVPSSSQNEFHFAADSLEFAVTLQIESHRAVLSAVRAWMQAAPNPTGPEFDRFTRELIHNDPAILSLNWAPSGDPFPVTHDVGGRFALPIGLAVGEGPPGHGKTQGYVVGLFAMDEFLARSLSRLPQPVDIVFFDLRAEPVRVLYRHYSGPAPRTVSLPSLAEALREEPLKHVKRFDVGGGEWAMVVTGSESHSQTRTTWVSWNVVALVLVITGISAAHFHVQVASSRSDDERHQFQLRKAAEDALRVSEERYELASRGSKDGLWDWDLRAGTIFYSERWKSMLGLDVKALGNSPEEWFGRIYPADRSRVEVEIAQHCSGRTDRFQSEYRILHNDGSYHWMLSRGLAVVDADGLATRLAGSQTDITESKAADPLTGLASRLLLDEKLQLAIDSLRADPREPFAVLLLDLDRFKTLNDSLGHLAGDQLLLRVANRLLACVAEPPFDRLRTLVARVGGDEFAILLGGFDLPDKAWTDTAMALANRIQDRMTRALDLEGRQLFVSLSIGVRIGQSDTTPETLLLDADTAMHYARSRSRQRCEIFVPAMRLEAVERLRLETDLRSAIERDEFIVCYQPKVCIRTGALIELEALVRWLHPERGLVSPMEFIPLAEETGLILPLGECVLRKACGQMRSWLRDYQVPACVRVSVNLSFRQFRQPDLFERILGILEETGLPPDRLSLEITEGVLMENVEAAVVLMNRLRERKIGLQLDDFGTGYSSLSYLRRLPFDGLKIDKSFVQETGLGQENAEIVATIALLARTLGMKVLAEGVETRSQLQMLLNAGCDYAQGNLFSAAVDSESATAFFRGFRNVLNPVASSAG